MHDALPKRPINQLKPVQQSRQQAQRASYCSNIYTVILGIFFASLGQMFSEFPKYEAYAYVNNGTIITDAIDLKAMIEWPGWSLAIAAILILISILWIPVVAGLR